MVLPIGMLLKSRKFCVFIEKKSPRGQHDVEQGGWQSSFLLRSDIEFLSESQILYLIINQTSDYNRDESPSNSLFSDFFSFDIWHKLQ